MMMPQEDRLQALLEQLESGTPLEALRGDLAAKDEEGELLALAAAMRGLDIPARRPADVSDQRTQIVQAVRQANGSPAGWWEGIRRRLDARPQLAWSSAAIAALVLIAWGWWLFANPTGRPGPAGPPPLAVIPQTEVAAIPVPPVEQSRPEAIAVAPESRVDLFLPLLGFPLVTMPDQATVHGISGVVEIAAAGGEWQLAGEGTRIAASDRLRTGRLSQATLTFYDGSAAALGPLTEITVETLNALLPEAGFRTVVLSQQSGSSTHTVDHRGDAGSRYEVRTPNASGVARGTRFTVDVADGRPARYTVSEGRVDVSGGGRTVPVAAGQLTTVDGGEAPSRPVFTVTGRGEVTQIGPVWIIAGQRFTVTTATVIVGDPRVGDTVTVTGHLAADGSRVADRIEKVAPSLVDRFTLVGTVDSISPAVWVVSGQKISVTAATVIDDVIVAGNTVRVAGRIETGGGLTAERIDLIENKEGRPFAFAGVVSSINPWIIAGVPIAVDGQTKIGAGIVIGDVVEVKGTIRPDGRWLAAEIRRLESEAARFSLTGELTGIDPWSVAGVPFTTNARTLIPAGLQVGDMVFVAGRILANGTWLAEVIEKIDEDSLLEIIFAGKVEKIAPWVISGLPIQTDAGTVIDPGIAVGDLVRVTVRVQANGVWLALRIELLSDEEIGEECVALTAVVTAINQGLVTFSDGTTVALGSIPVDGELRVGSVVVLIACVDDDGAITIRRIIVLHSPAPRPTPVPPPGGTPESGAHQRVTICHKPGTPAEKTMTLPRPALSGHLGHGDALGPCP